MILCKRVDFDTKKIQEVIREAFPELIRTFPEKWGLKKIKTEVVGCHKSHSSKFDAEIKRLETTAWNGFLFMALRLVKEGDETYCRSFPIWV